MSDSQRGASPFSPEEERDISYSLSRAPSSQTAASANTTHDTTMGQEAVRAWPCGGRTIYLGSSLCGRSGTGTATPVPSITVVIFVIFNVIAISITVRWARGKSPGTLNEGIVARKVWWARAGRATAHWAKGRLCCRLASTSSVAACTLGTEATTDAQGRQSCLEAACFSVQPLRVHYVVGC